MNEWRDYSLGELINIKHGYAFPGEFITAEATPNVLVTPGNFHIGGGFKQEKLKYFRGKYPESYLLKEGDIVVTMTDLSQETDTLGFSAKIPNKKGIEFLHNQRIGLLEFISDDADKDFIYWLLRTNEYQGFIVGASSGTSIRHTSPKFIKEYKFKLPPPKEQKAIASVLSSLDDKIDLLHRQNTTLERMAGTLFRQWFVEEAQEDYVLHKLGDCVTISYGKNLPTKNLLDDGFPVFGANGQIGFYDRYTYGEPQVLVSCRGEASGKVNISLPKSYITNNSLVLERNKMPEISFEFLKYWALSYDFDLHVSGSAQPQITIDGLYDADFILPPKDLIEKFTEMVKGLETKKLNNFFQIKTLEKLRDNLLPKLMSGEVRVGATG